MATMVRPTSGVTLTTVINGSIVVRVHVVTMVKTTSGVKLELSGSIAETILKVRE